ncbi:hypothetical protein CYLTODRAFT_417752 [Cylindrobasidium torrendii FP15055 ss-10]|uniref:Uncharacterized protein n=1 Tax=Cylindrobasidium torrendii FP15055 ss-10 TaxID=1314674 RepID=A0A0D7BSG6_9AGAR|nr:hypothetical protein CYLTODRAFT_417752 [Cylindrobasidium torrendii FP15055 ss-10]
MQEYPRGFQNTSFLLNLFFPFQGVVDKPPSNPTAPPSLALIASTPERSSPSPYILRQLSEFID